MYNLCASQELSNPVLSRYSRPSSVKNPQTFPSHSIHQVQSNAKKKKEKSFPSSETLPWFPIDVIRPQDKLYTIRHDPTAVTYVCAKPAKARNESSINSSGIDQVQWDAVLQIPTGNQLSLFSVCIILLWCIDREEKKIRLFLFRAAILLPRENGGKILKGRVSS